jgi:hypothetical protein
MKGLLCVSMLLLLVACSMPTASLAVTPLATQLASLEQRAIVDDDRLRAVCGKRELKFTNEVTGLPALLRPGGTYYSTLPAMDLIGPRAINGTWFIKRGMVFTDITLPPWRGGVITHYWPMPLRLISDGTCEVQIPHSNTWVLF